VIYYVIIILYYIIIMLYIVCYFQYTLVIINTEVPADRCHYVVNYLLDMCRQSQVLRVIVLSCLRTELGQV